MYEYNLWHICCCCCTCKINEALKRGTHSFSSMCFGGILVEGTRNLIYTCLFASFYFFIFSILTQHTARQTENVIICNIKFNNFTHTHTNACMRVTLQWIRARYRNVYIIIIVELLFLVVFFFSSKLCSLSLSLQPMRRWTIYYYKNYIIHICTARVTNHMCVCVCVFLYDCALCVCVDVLTGLCVGKKKKRW